VPFLRIIAEASRGSGILTISVNPPAMVGDQTLRPPDGTMIWSDMNTI